MWIGFPIIHVFNNKNMFFFSERLKRVFGYTNLFEVPVDEAFQSIVSNALLMEPADSGSRFLKGSRSNSITSWHIISSKAVQGGFWTTYPLNGIPYELWMEFHSQFVGLLNVSRVTQIIQREARMTGCPRIPITFVRWWSGCIITSKKQGIWVPIPFSEGDWIP